MFLVMRGMTAYEIQIAITDSREEAQEAVALADFELDEALLMASLDCDYSLTVDTDLKDIYDVECYYLKEL